jgi:hypothetical protein
MAHRAEQRWPAENEPNALLKRRRASMRRRQRAHFTDCATRREMREQRFWRRLQHDGRS